MTNHLKYFQVQTYKSVADFEAGLNEHRGLGREPHSWQECGDGDGWYIVVVFRQKAQ